MNGQPRQFVKMLTAIMCRTDLAPVAKLLYASIADRIGNNGQAWPSIRRLAADIGVDATTISRALRDLKQAGLLSVDSGGAGRNNIYRLTEGVCKTPTPQASDCMQNAIGGVCKTPSGVYAKRPTNQNNKPESSNQRKSTPSENECRDELMKAVREEFRLKPVTKRDKTRLNCVVKEFLEKGATGCDIRVRAERYRHEWPNVPCTPEALCKHWDTFIDSVALRRPQNLALDRASTDAQYERVMQKKKLAGGQ